MTVLECKNLSKSYGNTEALSDISLKIQSGKIIGLLGPNGSGKTTLIKLANGLLQPTDGEILICDMPPSVETKSLVSYLPERLSLPLWMKTEQVVKYYADFYEDFSEKTAREMLKRLEISEKQKIKEMSKGTREKLQLIMVMSRNAKLYLLDEPIGGVDPAARDYIISTILTNYNPEASVIISTHLIADIEQILDEVVFINRGKLELHKSVDDLREESGKSIDGVFREVFRC